MKQYRNLIKPYLVWAFVVIVIPLILIALYAFTEDGNEVLTFSFTLENFRKFLEATYMSVIFKSFKLGILTTVICLGLWLSTGIHYFQMSGEIPESSDPAGNYSGMDQYASAYLCMDEPAVRQWYHQPFAWITGDFPGDNDVYGLFRSGWSGL